MNGARVAISVSIDAGMYAAMESRAKVMGCRPSEYVRRLVEAAYAARVGREKRLPATDRELDEAVRAVFCLSGEFDAALIARATGFSTELVSNVLRGFRQTAGEAAARPLPLPAPEQVQAVDRTIRAGKETEARAVFDPAQKETIAGMWAEGKSAAMIGEAVDADADTIRRFAAEHRDLCAARDAPQMTRLRSLEAWPPEKVETVRTMWADGKSCAEIGAAIGKTAGAVSVWAGKHRDVCPKRRGA